MLDKYIEELAKTSSVQEKLDAHLESLTKTAAEKVAQEKLLKNASVGELAKLAGVKLPEQVCTDCGAEMQKLGSVYQCACGMMKKTAKDMPPFLKQDRPAKVKEIYSALKRDHPDMPAEMKARIAARKGKKSPQSRKPPETGGPKYKAPITPWHEKKGAVMQVAGPSEGVPAQMVHRTSLAPLTEGEASGERTGRRVGSAIGTGLGVLGGGALGAAIPTLLRRGMVGRAADELPPKMIQRLITGRWRIPLAVGGGLLGAGLGGAALGAAGRLAGGEIGQTAGGALGKTGSAQEKTASFAHFAKAMRLNNGNIDQALSYLEKEGFDKLGFSLSGVKPALQSAWGAIKPRAQEALGAVTGKARQVGQTFQAARAAGAPGAKGLMGAIGQTAAAHPGVAAGATGAAGLGAGYMMGKGASANSLAVLIKVGDAAGRVLAKMAETPGVDVDPEELAEAIDEAKGRENVPGRSRAWGMGGAALGGMAGGGLGYGASRLLGARPWLRAGAAGLGALAGGAGGAYLGSREGAEEAQADQLVSLLRGRRAFQTGAQEGYGQGMQHGYLAGMSGGQGEEEAGPQ